MRDNSYSDLFFHSNFKRLIGNPNEKINQTKILNPAECGEKFFKFLWTTFQKNMKSKDLF